jgi:ComF family protein
MRWIDWIANLLFPPKCPFCGQVLDEVGICAGCERDLPWTKGEETLRTGADGLRCVAPLWYEALVRKGLLRLKFQGVSGAAEPMGGLVARCAAEEFSGAFDTVTWVPVSEKRLRKRGFDQAELLARRVGELSGIPVVDALEKTRETATQSLIEKPSERRANVLGAYRVREGAELQGKRVVLVDDVVTSGATLAECAACLRMAGAEQVIALTLACAKSK